MKKETQLLKDAVNEIRNLRRKNEIMSARLEMFDAVNALFNARIPGSGGGMSPDICWEIEQYIVNNEKHGKGKVYRGDMAGI